MTTPVKAAKGSIANQALSSCSYNLLDSDLSIVLGHSDDVATLKAIQTIVHSMSAVKHTADPVLKSSYLSSE